MPLSSTVAQNFADFLWFDLNIAVLVSFGLKDKNYLFLSELLLTIVTQSFTENIQKSFENVSKWQSGAADTVTFSLSENPRKS